MTQSENAIWITGTLARRRPQRFVLEAPVPMPRIAQSAMFHDGNPMHSVSRRAITRPVKGIELGISVAITNLIGSSLFAVGVADVIGITAFNALVNVLTYAVGFGALAGASLLLSGGGPGRPEVRGPESQQQSYELEDGPRIIGLGRARIGGVFGLRASTGFNTYRLQYGCQGPVDAIEEYYVRGREVVVDFDGAVSSPPYARSGGSYLRLYSKLGTADQTAFSQLTSAFPDNWTTAHRMRGVLAVLAQFTSPGVTDPLFLKVWPEGYPGYDVLARIALVYDPRKDSTQGGSGSHRTDDPDTWEWSDNGVLCNLWFLTASEEDGGFGLSFDNFDLEDIAAQADLADDTQDSAQGVGAERRSVISGSYTTDTPRAQILGELMQSAGLIMVTLQNGKYSLHLEDDNPASTVTIAREDILDVVWGGDEIVTEANQLELFYHAPERQWQMAELEIHDKAWARDATSIANTGKRTETLSLKFCPQPGQAQRIARRVFAKRRALRGAPVSNLAGLSAMGHPFGTVEMDIIEDGWAPKVEFGEQELSDDGKEISNGCLFLETLSAWDPDTDEAAAPIDLGDIEFAGDVGTTSITQQVLVKTGASTDELRIAFSAADGATLYEATYRSWDGSISGPRLSMTENNGSRWAFSDADVDVGDRNLIEVRGANGDGEVGLWSDAVDYTAAYDTAAPAGLSLSFSDDYAGAGDNFTATIDSGCSDLNISTYLLQVRERTKPSGMSWGSWSSYSTVGAGTSYVRPGGYDDTETLSPPGAVGDQKEFEFLLTATNSTGQSATLNDSFGITRTS